MAHQPEGPKTVFAGPLGLFHEAVGSRGWPVEKLLDINEAASLLGVKPQTLYLWVSQKRIAYRKIGRLVRFQMCDLEEFVDQVRQPVLVEHHEHL